MKINKIKHYNKKNTYLKGFTLIEMTVYIGLIIIITTIITYLTSQLIQTYTYANITESVLDNARRSVDIIVQEIRHSSSVYEPTSVFGVHPGQLSLETSQNLPTDETLTFVDFYIDDDRLYRKREGQNAELLTSERVKVSQLIFTHLNPTSTSTAIRISLTMVYDSTSPQTTAESTVSFFTTVSLRSY